MVATARTPQRASTATLSPFLREPSNVEETGLDLSFVADLVVKMIYFNSMITAQAIVDTVCLPFFNVVDRALTLLKREELIEVVGSSGFGELAYQYLITPKGANRANDVINRSGYVGPAPVTLEAYKEVIKSQSIGNVKVTPSDVRRATADLIVPEEVLDTIGQAVTTRRSLFLYGEPGNGKTSSRSASPNSLVAPSWSPMQSPSTGRSLRFSTCTITSPSQHLVRRPTSTGAG